MAHTEKGFRIPSQGLKWPSSPTRLYMKKGAGKNKGSSYERLIGSKLSLWISNGERDDLLCRTVGSGAQFTAVNKGHAGDLRSQDILADKFCKSFVIECKHWRDLQILRFLRKEGELYRALVKVQNEAKSVGKSWLLIARQNNNPDIILSPSGSRFEEFILDYHKLFGGSVYLFQLQKFLDAFRVDNICSSEILLNN